MKNLKAWAAMALLCVMPLALAGCAGFNQATGVDLVVPISSDYSLEQNAYAGLRAYGESAQIVADIVEDPDTPAAVKTVLATALLNTEAPARAVKDGWQEYARLKAEIDVRRDAGEPIAEALLKQAADAYFTAKELWREHEDSITTFPGIVRAVEASG